MNRNMIKVWLYECKYMYSLVEPFKYYVPTWPKYSFSYVTPPFLRIN